MTQSNQEKQPRNNCLRQFADSEVAELDGGTLGFEAKVADSRLTVGAAGDLDAVDPQAHFAIDRADVIVVPLVDALRRVF